MSPLTDLGSALVTYGGLSYLVRDVLLMSFMSCLHTTRFYLWGMDYLCTLLFIIIQWKDTLQYSSLHSCDFVSCLLSIFPVYVCENYLSSKIYFLCFFLASFLIALIYYFYMVSDLQGEQPFHLLHGIRAARLIKFYRVDERI